MTIYENVWNIILFELLVIRMSCLFMQVLMFPLTLSRYLANAVQSAVIFLWISLSWFYFWWVDGLYRSGVDICVNLHHHLCLHPVHFQTLIFTPICYPLQHLLYKISEFVVENIWYIIHLSWSLWDSKSSLEYAFEYCFGPVVFLRLSPSLCFLCVGGLPSSCRCTCISGIRCIHHVIFMSRSQRTQCRVGYYIIGTSPPLGLRRGRGWFSSSVLSSLFVSTSQWIHYIRLIPDTCGYFLISFLFPFFKMSMLRIFISLISI